MSIKTVDQLTSTEKEWYINMFEKYNEIKEDKVVPLTRSFSAFVTYMQDGDLISYPKIRPCCSDYKELK